MGNKESGFFELFERSIDESFRDSKEAIEEGTRLIKKGAKEMLSYGKESNEEGSPEVSPEDAMKQLLKTLMSRLEEVALPASDDFSYATILKWVKINHKGNQFYMVKRVNPKNGITYLFVFFADDKYLFCDEKDPMICYLVRSMPHGINDMFNGKDIFIQKFE